MAFTFKTVRWTSPRHERVEAVATVVMWFAAGAFATSTIVATFTSYESHLIAVAGGAVVAAILTFICKAV
jgi:hypothetical protein